MKYRIFKDLNNDNPGSFNDIYFSPMLKEYFSLACEMIIEDGKYRFEGGDEFIINKFKKLLEIEPKNHLLMEISGSLIDDEGIEVFWDGHKEIPIDHPDFQTALRETAGRNGYTVNPKNFDFQFVKVNSLAGVERVKREYEERNSQQERKAA